MTAHPTPACRHPKVIMLYDNEDDILGAASIIAEQVEDYRTLLVDKEIGNKIKKYRPSVILLALSCVQKSIKFYTQLITDHSLNYPHHSILLCKNRESGAAFRCCIKGLFDNYFVYQPLYEKFRLKMIVHNGLQISQSTSQYIGFQDNQLESIGEDLALLIDEAGTCKHDLLNSIAACKNNLKNANEVTQTPSASEQLIQKINKTHIEPLLVELEGNIKAGLDKMINQLLVKQVGIKELEARVEEMNKISVPDQQSILEALSNTASSLTNPPKGAVKILVVEDNKLYRDMLVNILVKEKYDTDEASDGLNALKKIKNTHYDLVLMDLFMPNLDGINTTKQIKTVTGCKKLPIIALTGNKNKDLIKTWAEQGLKGYILKPSTKREILEAVNKVLN
ncbi:response regulator [Shewanella sp. D64]|uniref:response regulator n=1 Tax=unclassified Shewanella TaxID=196818 RepID=UPI0022BA6104|nr:MULTISPECIES: response regulator [unclassified Shewanella]MEC4727294.1 response regulator [Shewanella sp. D64]MEC4739449.1 response regulator [Shewanella sp. E94]WBJ96778.1 response regulator [Shewanella sp. MTB7]